MADVSSLHVGRFMRLPRRSDERWQGGLVRLPSWVESPDGPYRPWAGLWVSRSTGLIHLKMEDRRDAHDWTLACAALIEFGLKANLVGCRPAVLEVADRDLGERIRAVLADPELQVVDVPELAAVRSVLAAMEEDENDGAPSPGALAGRGVTVERMRSFAGAARRFWDAAPWRHLTDEDLVHVEAPVTAPGLGHCTVLGGAGHMFGLGFFDSADDFEAFQEAADAPPALDRPRWSVLFGPMTDMPFADVDLWEEHDLPVAAGDAYPLALQFNDEGVRRPDARTLAYLEGLLTALAGTTEDEIDSGRWTRECTTYEGTVRYRLAIPALLEPIEADASDESGSTPVDQAQDLAYLALDAFGRRRIQLARKALALSRDCADGWAVLAEETPDPERACALYAEAVSAGARALGPEVFEREAGHFWDLVRTRPYMRARFALADRLESLGRRDEALEHYLELLRLNPRDSQGVRERALPALLLAGRDGDAADLLDRYGGDTGAVLQYGRALVDYRRDRDGAGARESLGQALRANRWVARYLTGAAPLPAEDPDRYAFGSEEEAVIAARLLTEAWRATPGATEWLSAAARARRGGGKKRR